MHTMEKLHPFIFLKLGLIEEEKKSVCQKVCSYTESHKLDNIEENKRKRHKLVPIQ